MLWYILCVCLSTADYTAVSVELTFNSGSFSHDVMVAALHDRVISEDVEEFSLSLTGDPAVQFSVSTATVTITDASMYTTSKGSHTL